MPFDLIPFRFPGVPRVRCAFGTRALGNVSLDIADAGPARNTRREILEHLPGTEAFAEVHQVHGVRTLFDPPPQDPAHASVADADGMATGLSGLALMIKTADCQPILLAHGGGHFVAALHCGWRGNRQEYPRLAVEECCAHYHVHPSELWAVRGPSLGIAEFIHFGDEWGEAFLPWYNAQESSVDLWRLTRHQLTSAGIPSGQILALDLCTFTHAETFFSYRHHRRFGSRDGRQGSFIWLTGAQRSAHGHEEDSRMDTAGTPA